jgi:hypothetical protein
MAWVRFTVAGVVVLGLQAPVHRVPVQVGVGKAAYLRVAAALLELQAPRISWVVVAGVSNHRGQAGT